MVFMDRPMAFQPQMSGRTLFATNPFCEPRCDASTDLGSTFTLPEVGANSLLYPLRVRML